MRALLLVLGTAAASAGAWTLYIFKGDEMMRFIKQIVGQPKKEGEELSDLEKEIQALNAKADAALESVDEPLPEVPEVPIKVDLPEYSLPSNLEEGAEVHVDESEIAELEGALNVLMSMDEDAPAAQAPAAPTTAAPAPSPPAPAAATA